jgi:hypothetical protein
VSGAAWILELVEGAVGLRDGEAIAQSLVLVSNLVPF